MYRSFPQINRLLWAFLLVLGLGVGVQAQSLVQHGARGGFGWWGVREQVLQQHLGDRPAVPPKCAVRDANADRVHLHYHYQARVHPSCSSSMRRRR